MHCLIITHIGSGGTLLCRLLSTNLKVHCFGCSGTIYNHPSVIKRACITIDKIVGKRFDPNDLYIDKLMYNYEFTCKPLYKSCKFIYLIRSPYVPIATSMKKYSLEGAVNYYFFRLRRICEMARKSGGLLLTYEDLINKKAFPLLQNFLNLKSLSDQFTPTLFDDQNLRSGKILKYPAEPTVEMPDLQKYLIKYNKYSSFLAGLSPLLQS